MARAKHLGPIKRRPLVLDAALTLFVSRGFEATSMAAVSRAAGVAKPVLYDCFPGGKQEIYVALVDREARRILAHLQGVLATTRRLPFREGLRLGLNAFFDYSEINPLGFRFTMDASGTADPELGKRTKVAFEGIVQVLSERAFEIAESLGAPPVVGEIFTRSIVSSAYSLASWWARDKPIERNVLTDFLTAFVMQGLEGLVPAEILNRGVRSESAHGIGAEHQLDMASGPSGRSGDY